MNGFVSTKAIHVCLIAYVLIATTGAVSAQTLALPPIRQVIDANGVDLMSGQFSLVASDIDIGPPESNLAYTRAVASNVSGGYGYRASTDLFLTVETARATVAIGSAIEQFDVSGSTFTVTNGMGSTLVFDTPSNNYVYTQRDGTVIRFPAKTSSDDANGLRALSVLEPDGTLTEYAIKKYPVPGLPWLTDSRVQSVVNNAGYQMKMEYGDSIRTMSPTKVAVLNRTQVYCDPTADTCSATSGAPAATFAWTQAPYDPTVGYVYLLTATDALNRTTQWRMGAVESTPESTGPSAVKSKMSSTYDTTATFENFGQGPFGPAAGVTQVVRRGMTWDYQILQFFSSQPTVKVTDPLGNSREVTTDLAKGLLMSDKDELGNITSYLYDSLGRRTRITYPEGNYIQIAYDARGNVTESRHVAKPGTSIPDIVESAAYPTTCSNPKTCNQPTSTTDARGQITDYTYDGTHGGVLTVTEPAPYAGAVRPQTRYSYTALYAWYRNSAGTLVQSPSPIYKLTGTSSCRTTASCENASDEVKTTYAYQVGSSSVGSNLLLASVTQSAGDGSLSRVTTLTFDDRGNRTAVDGPLFGTADTTTTRYDVLRRVTGAIGPDPDATDPLKRRALRYSFNDADQLTSVDRGTVNGLTENDWSAFSTLETMAVGYDTAGRRSSLYVSSAGSTFTYTQFSYDEAGRPQCAARRMNPATFGSLPACTVGATGSFGLDRITKRVYDAAGRIYKIQSGVGTTLQRDESTITYTNNGKVQTVTDARNSVTTYEYDRYDRVFKTRYPSPSGASSTTDYEQYTHDAGGLLTEHRLRDGQIIGFGNDNLGRVQTRNLPGSEADISYGYDNLGHTTSISQSGTTLTFGYDSLGRLRTQTGPQGTLSSDYDIVGRRTRLTWPDQFYVEYDYLVTGEMSAIRENGATSGVGVLASYAYDNLGRRTSVTRGNGTSTSYQYDGASRLQELKQNLTAATSDQRVEFGYSPAGQIATRTSDNDSYTWVSGSNTTTTYNSNSLNQYSNIGGVTPSYDARGNLTNFGTGTFGYSSENFLTSAPGSVTLSYDPAGRLQQTSSGAGSVRFSYDGDDLVAEYNASNQLRHRYVFGPEIDEPVVWYDLTSGSAVRRWLHADERGSVVAVSDALGAAYGINRYDEYGEPASGNVGRFQFTGQLWIPEVGLYYFKARFYSASLGRFLQTDPIGYAGGLNLYAYVSADPINRRDPTGTTEEVIVPGAPYCGIDCRSYEPGDFFQDFYLTQEQWDLFEAQVLSNLQSALLESTIDDVVVTARKKKLLAGVVIDMTLVYPNEQMWFVIQDGTIIPVPTVSEITHDSCGNELGANRVAEGFTLPEGAHIVAVIHTHPNWASTWPFTGDYDQAKKFSVYGIHKSGTWVLRHGAGYNSAPEKLSGKAATKPSSKGTSCTMSKKK